MEEKQGDQTRFCPVPENLSIYQNKTSKSKYQGRDIGEMEGEEFISLWTNLSLWPENKTVNPRHLPRYKQVFLRW